MTRMMANACDFEKMKRKIGEIFRCSIVPFGIWYLLWWLDIYTLQGQVFSERMRDVVYLFAQPFCYACLCSGLMILLGRFQRLLVPLYVYVFFVEVLEFFLRMVFGSYFTGDLLLIALNSSWDEIATVLAETFSVKTVLAVAGLACVGVLLARLLFRPRRPIGWMQRVCAFAVSCLPFLALDVGYMAVSYIPVQTLASRLIRDTIIAYRDDAELWKACKRPLPFGDVKIDRKGELPPVGVIVIGESMTRNNMQIYGYGRATTPGMCSIADGEIFAFGDVLTSWSNTQGALRHLLTELELDGNREPMCALPEVCRRAGYVCVLLSNQCHWGAYDTLDTMLFLACSPAVWISELKSERRLHDIDMVDMLGEMVATNAARPIMSFVHLAGSHSPCRSYPKELEVFPEDLSDAFNRHLAKDGQRYYNRYDNTIALTDRTFSGLVGVVRKTHRPGFVLLISDHGETPRVGSVRSMRHRDLWEIPMVVWVSEEYRRTYPETVRALRESVSKKLQQDQLFMGLLTLSHVIGHLRYEPERDFLSPRFRGRERRMVENGRKIYENDK